MANVTFPFPFPEHLITLLPEMIVAIMAMFLLLFDVFVSKERRTLTPYLAILTVIVAGIGTTCLRPEETLVAFYGFFVFDQFAVLCQAADLCGYRSCHGDFHRPYEG